MRNKRDCSGRLVFWNRHRYQYRNPNFDTQSSQFGHPYSQYRKLFPLAMPIIKKGDELKAPIPQTSRTSPETEETPPSLEHKPCVELQTAAGTGSRDPSELALFVDLTIVIRIDT
jgi:hypothetical protein